MADNRRQNDPRSCKNIGDRQNVFFLLKGSTATKKNTVNQTSFFFAPLSSLSGEEGEELKLRQQTNLWLVGLLKNLSFLKAMCSCLTKLDPTRKVLAAIFPKIFSSSALRITDFYKGPKFQKKLLVSGTARQWCCSCWSVSASPWLLDFFSRHTFVPYTISMSVWLPMAQLRPVTPCSLRVSCFESPIVHLSIVCGVCSVKCKALSLYWECSYFF